MFAEKGSCWGDINEILSAITCNNNIIFATAFLWSLHLLEIFMYCQFDFLTFKPSTKSDDQKPKAVLSTQKQGHTYKVEQGVA